MLNAFEIGIQKILLENPNGVIFDIDIMWKTYCLCSRNYFFLSEHFQTKQFKVFVVLNLLNWFYDKMYSALYVMHHIWCNFLGKLWQSCWFTKSPITSILIICWSYINTICVISFMIIARRIKKCFMNLYWSEQI